MSKTDINQVNKHVSAYTIRNCEQDAMKQNNEEGFHSRLGSQEWPLWENDISSIRVEKSAL